MQSAATPVPPQLAEPPEGFKTAPFAHQLSYLERHAHDEAHGLGWEQGTGKTKAIIDNAAILWCAGKIGAVIVVAPPGVDRNWLYDELPVHQPDDMARASRTMLWRQAKHATLTHKRELAALIAHDGPVWLFIKYQSMMTKAGAEAVWQVMQKCGARKRPSRPGRVLMVCDESAHDGAIKTPSGETSQRVKEAGKYASHRRTADGTPEAESPFDLYAQQRFLDPRYWKAHGLSPFVTFRTHFGVWATGSEVFKEVKRNGKTVTELVGYKAHPLSFRNLDELKTHKTALWSRVTKEDVLDLPPKLYQKHRFELSREQRSIYERLKKEYLVELASGGMVEAALPIVRLLRLQQVTCGYLPTGDEVAVLENLPGPNTRLDALEELRPRLVDKTLVWCRFIGDVDRVMDLLGKTARRYDGTLNDDECQRSKEEFQHGDARWLVLTLAKGHSGLTLHAAKNNVYYSNTFRARHRLQSEDRPHRAGMDDRPVNNIDLVAEDTVDEQIVAALRRKFDIATQLTGDQLREWL